MSAIDEPLAGTAPLAQWWWLIESPGAWGREAIAESHIVGLRHLTSTAERRVLLVRRPGRHPARESNSVRVWVAGAMPDAPPTRVALVEDARELADWDPLDPPADRLVVDPDAPLLAVCTNAKRDACCGIDGRALLSALSPVDMQRTWECSHLGGHRFAPTALHVPTGVVYGRLDPEAAHQIINGDIPWPYVRGRSCLSAPQQVAECALSCAGRVIVPGSVATVPSSDTDDVVVRAQDMDGSMWEVTVEPYLSAHRPASCGAVAEDVISWRPSPLANGPALAAR